MKYSPLLPYAFHQTFMPHPSISHNKLELNLHPLFSITLQIMSKYSQVLLQYLQQLFNIHFLQPRKLIS